ncbi:hypothetical protein Plhal304r1_c013g0049751 [Plasmopara halstedii]
MRFARYLSFLLFSRTKADDVPANLCLEWDRIWSLGTRLENVYAVKMVTGMFNRIFGTFTCVPVVRRTDITSDIASSYQIASWQLSSTFRRPA